MKTINIKGKEYVPVVERVKEFHNLYKGSITTEVVEFGNRVSVKATIAVTHKKGKLSGSDIYEPFDFTFTGHSQAEYGKGMMGDVALEIAETSAVGRALGFANIGLIDGIASADEMRKVGHSEEKTTKPVSSYESAVNALNTCISKESRDELLAKMLKSTKLSPTEKVQIQDFKAELDSNDLAVVNVE